MSKVEKNLQAGLKFGENVFIADNVSIVGNVTLGNNVGIWYNTVIRGDIAEIIIGDGSNIQDGSVLHVGYNEPLIVGKNVTVGHNVNLHGCKVYDNCLIGMGSIVLNGAVIEENAIIAAGSVVPPKKVVKSGTLYMGSPAKYARDLTEADINHIKKNAEEYMGLIPIYNKYYEDKK